VSRKTYLDARSKSQRKRSGKYRQSLRDRGIPFKPKRRK